MPCTTFPRLTYPHRLLPTLKGVGMHDLESQQSREYFQEQVVLSLCFQRGLTSSQKEGSRVGLVTLNPRGTNYMCVLQNTKSYAPPDRWGGSPWFVETRGDPQNTKGITALPGW